MTSHLTAAALLALAVLGCGPKPAPRVVSKARPFAPPAAEPAITQAPAENPDDLFRYTPPLPGPSALATTPAIEDSRLPNGLRLRVLPRTESPLVVITAVLQWKNRSPRLQALLTNALFRVTLAGRSRSVLEELDAIGAQTNITWNYDATVLRLIVSSQVLSDALGLLSGVLQGAQLTAEVLSRARQEYASHLLTTTSPRLTLVNRARAILLPAGHPYREPEGGSSPEDLNKVGLDELRRYRDAELRPEIVTLCVVGDAAPSEVAQTAAKLFGPWRVAASAPPRRPAVSVARGVYVEDDPGRKPASLAIVVPVPTADVGQEVAAQMVLSLVGKALAAKGRPSASKAAWKNVSYNRGALAQDVCLLFITADVEPADAGGFVRAALDEAAKVAAGRVSEIVVASLRSDPEVVFDRAWDGVRESAEALTWGSLDGPLFNDVFLGRVSGELGRDDLARAARTYFSAPSVRVVALGNAVALKESLRGVDVGKQPSPKGAPLGGRAR